MGLWLWTVIITFLLSCLWVSSAQAADRFWVGAGGGDDDRWEDTTNWSTLEKGAGGASVPGASDVAIFSASGTTVTFRSAVSVQGLEIKSVWTGSILQGTGTLTVGSEGFKMGSGSFVGGNATIAISGGYTQTGGIVSGIQNTFTLSGSYSLTNGAGVGIPDPSFTSTGTIVLDGNADQNFTKGASTTVSLTNLTLENSGGGTSDDVIVNANGNLNLSGALTVTQGNLDLTTNSMALVVERGITLANDAQASLTTNSNVTASGTILVNDLAVLTVTAGTLTLNDDGDQAVDLDGQSIFNLTLNNTGGGTTDDVTIAGGPLQLSGALTVTLGNLDLDTNDINMVTEGAITIANNAQATFTTGGDITASGSIAVGAAGLLTMNGTKTLTMNGNTAQTLDLNNALLNNLTIASTTSTTLATSNTRVSGTLQINTGSTLALSTLTLAATGATIINYATLTENTGKVVHTATNFKITDSGFSNEITSLLIGNTIYFTLTETDENIDGTALDTVSITVTGGSDSEAVTLTETTNFSGIFHGSIPTAKGSAGNNNGTLELSRAATITATFTDAQDALENTDTISSAGVTVRAGGAAHRRVLELNRLANEANNNLSASIQTSGIGGGGNTTMEEDQTSSLEEDAVHTAADDTSMDNSQKESDNTEKLSIVSELPNARGKLQANIGKSSVIFHDIPVQEWFASFVLRMTEAGIASGYKDSQGRLLGEYGPANPVTYAEIAKMALETIGKGQVTVGIPVNRSAHGQWSEKYIAIAELIQLSVYTEKLDVNLPATRGAVIQTIVEVLGLPLEEATEEYTDLRTSHPHAQAIITATRFGIITGDTDSEGNLKGTVRPNAPINRAEVAKILSKVLELDLQ